MKDGHEQTSSSEADGTLAFYETNAEAYASRAAGADLSALYQVFFDSIPRDARILDVGCGSGRDLKIFKQHGYRATGIDPSPAMASVSRAHSGCQVLVTAAENIDFENTFDGVWACASLLHLPKFVLPRSLSRINFALSSQGAFFLSMLPGEGEGRSDDGRFFARYSPTELIERVTSSGFEVLNIWSTSDSLKESRSVDWLNVLARKAVRLTPVD